MQFQSPKQQRRYIALQALLVVTVPGALLFSGLNMEAGLRGLSVANLLLAVYSGGVLVGRLHASEPRLVTAFYILILLFTVAWALTEPEIHTTAYTWITLFPILSYLLLEPRRAFWLTSFSLLAAAGAFLFGAFSHTQRLDALGLADVAVPVIAMFVVCHFYSRSQAKFDAQMQARIGTDPLTGLGNRHRLRLGFEREQERAKRTGMPLSVILIDLDHFKQLNDSHGHEAGDVALVFISRLFKERLRETDLLFRIGGEEFIVLLPHTSANGATVTAEDLRVSLQKSILYHNGNEVRLTLSAGVAELGRDGVSWPELYRIADGRLYSCKARGRNCVSASENSERPSAACS